MEILKLIAVIVGAAFFLSACSPNNSYSLSYQEKDFSAGLCWESDDIMICATLISLSSDTTERDLSLTFSSPPSLNGITVSRKAGEDKTSVQLDGLELSLPSAVRWLDISKLFELEGSISDTYITDIDGISVNAVVANTEDGEYTVYLLPNSSLPRRICGRVNDKELTLDIIWFEISND